jgi:hypothetical protein
MLTQAKAPKAPNTKSDFCRTKGYLYLGCSINVVSQLADRLKIRTNGIPSELAEVNPAHLVPGDFFDIHDSSGAPLTVVRTIMMTRKEPQRIVEGVFGIHYFLTALFDVHLALVLTYYSNP